MWYFNTVTDYNRYIIGFRVTHPLLKGYAISFRKSYRISYERQKKIRKSVTTAH